MGPHASGKTFSLKLWENKTIDGQEYWVLVRYNCIPKLKAMNNGTLAGQYWQQDGAKVNRTNKVLTYLDEQFGARMLAIRVC